MVNETLVNDKKISFQPQGAPLKFMERIIYPVGFGAFFLEKFTSGEDEDLYVVYDCGSNTKGKKKYIADTIKNEIPKVDILFISHFHEDHINCIDKLPISTNTIVVLPYICVTYQIVFEKICEIRYSSLLTYLTRIGVKIVYVDPFIVYRQNGQNNNLQDNPIFYDIDKLPESPVHISPFAKLRLKQWKWFFIPFHLQERSVYEDFVYDALAAGITQEQLENYNGKCKTLTDNLKKIYAETCKKDRVCKNFNSSSMLVVSRPELKDEFRVSVKKYMPLRNFTTCDNPGCLYTGDFLLNYSTYCKMLVKLYSILMPFGVGTIQLPHHGSANGYDQHLYRDKEIQYVFCNCIDKPSGHKPALLFKAVYDAVFKGKSFFAVMGDDKSRLEFEIYK